MIVHQSLSKLEHSAQFTVLKYTLYKKLNIPPYEHNLRKSRNEIVQHFKNIENKMSFYQQHI